MTREITRKLKILFFSIQVGRLSEKKFIELVFKLLEEYKKK